MYIAAGYEPGKDVMIAMDCASSEFYHDGIYDYTKFEGEKGKKRTADEQIDYLEELINKYPIDSIEDGMSENDWDGWKKLTDRIGNRCQLVGDDLFVTNVDFLAMGIEKGCANSILIKVNQELTCMVRQLQPTDRGIPIELYFFCALKDWVPYEGVQADVFDHVLAIIPEFDLQVFQSPSGRDFQRVLPAASEEKGA